MNQTVVVTKDGERYQGTVWYFRPPEGFISLRSYDEQAQDWVEVRLRFDDISSAVTLGERVGINRIEDTDDLERARRYMRNARKYGWDACTTDTPLQAWELPVENCECSRE